MPNGFKVFLLVGSLLQINIAFAQRDSLPVPSVHQNAIGFGMGTHLGYLNDENYSPLTYRENGLLLSLFYEHKSKNEKRILFMRADYLSGKLSTSVDDHFTTDRLEGNVEASLLFRVNRSQKGFTFFLGPQLNLFAYYMEWGQERDAWNYLMVQGLNVKGLINYQATARKNFRSSVSIPVFGNLVRPPYNGFDQFIVEHQEEVVMLSFRGKPATVNDYFALDWRTSYRYAFTDRVCFNVEYLFRFQHVTDLNSMRRFQNQFSGGFVITF